MRDRACILLSRVNTASASGTGVDRGGHAWLCRVDGAVGGRAKCRRWSNCTRAARCPDQARIYAEDPGTLFVRVPVSSLRCGYHRGALRSWVENGTEVTRVL